LRETDLAPFSADLVFKVSDHYPVEFQLEARIHPILQESVKVFEQVSSFLISRVSVNLDDK
jgi:hypothetical protein